MFLSFDKKLNKHLKMPLEFACFFVEHSYTLGVNKNYSFFTKKFLNFIGLNKHLKDL